MSTKKPVSNTSIYLDNTLRALKERMEDNINQSFSGALSSMVSRYTYILDNRLPINIQSEYFDSLIDIVSESGMMFNNRLPQNLNAIVMDGGAKEELCAIVNAMDEADLCTLAHLIETGFSRNLSRDGGARG